MSETLPSSLIDTGAILRRQKMTLIGCLLLIVGVALYGLWLILFPTPQFPEPTGPYGIGTRIYYWTDDSRPEPFTADSSDHRRIVAQIWYPSNSTGPTERYIDHAEVLAALAQRLHMPSMLLGNIQNAPTHAVANGQAADGPFPVLVNPTGFSGFKTASLFWIEELVSQGYVVIGLDQPGTAAATVFSDGTVIPVMADKGTFDRYMPLALSEGSGQTPEMNGVPLPGGIIPFLADDLSLVLDELETVDRADPILSGKLDLDSVGVFGMSLGGYVGAEACYRDRRIKACLAVDAGKSAAVARDGLEQPLMIISRDAEIMREERERAGGWPEPEIEHTITSQRALFEHNQGDAYYLTMNSMYHVNWTDAPIWSPIIRWTGLAGPVDPYRGFAITNEFSVAFFDRYLKSRTSPMLAEAPPELPDLRLEVRLANPAL